MEGSFQFCLEWKVTEKIDQVAKVIIWDIKKEKVFLNDCKNRISDLNYFFVILREDYGIRKILRTNQAILIIFKDFKITFGGEIIRTFSFGGGHEARHRLEVKAELVVSQFELG